MTSASTLMHETVVGSVFPRVLHVDPDTGEIDMTEVFEGGVPVLSGEPRATGQPLQKTGRFVVLQSEDVPDDHAYLRYTAGVDQPGGMFGTTPSRLIEMLVNGDTWKTLLSSPGATGEFVREMSREGKAMGLQMLVADTGAGEAKGFYHEAQVARARQENDSTHADRLTALKENLNALIVQAASLNTRSTPTQQRMFAERLGDLQDRWEELERDITEVRSLVRLATVAVVEAA